jgi:hypothetical protein
MRSQTAVSPDLKVLVEELFERSFQAVLREMQHRRQLREDHRAARPWDRQEGQKNTFSEGHVQSLVFQELRTSKPEYYVESEAPYFCGPKGRREVDLAIWLPPVERWLYLEVKGWLTKKGSKSVRKDAKKLIRDGQRNCQRTLRGILVYGTYSSKHRCSIALYESVGDEELEKEMGFARVGIRSKDFSGDDDGWQGLQMGLWCIDGGGPE